MAYDDPRLIDEAKKKAAGPLGQKMAEFPLQFAAPVFFADIPAKDEQPKANNGTITLIKFGERLLGVTCFHVLNEYRKQLAQDPSRVFQIGNVRLAPFDRLIDESEDIDLATLDLTGLEASKIMADRELNYFEPSRWPPNPVLAGEFVALAGFPAVWREHPGHRKVSFVSFSLGATKVADVTQRNIVCLLEREHWIQSLGPCMPADLMKSPGLSGGPIFKWAGLAADLVGFIYECSASDDYLLIRPSRFICKDGTINEE